MAYGSINVRVPSCKSVFSIRKNANYFIWQILGNRDIETHIGEENCLCNNIWQLLYQKNDVCVAEKNMVRESLGTEAMRRLEPQKQWEVNCNWVPAPIMSNQAPHKSCFRELHEGWFFYCKRNHLIKYWNSLLPMNLMSQTTYSFSKMFSFRQCQQTSCKKSSDSFARRIYN